MQNPVNKAIFKLVKAHSRYMSRFSIKTRSFITVLPFFVALLCGGYHVVKNWDKITDLHRCDHITEESGREALVKCAEYWKD